jgi:tetratricopeptide (TPR) repeat protein
MRIIKMRFVNNRFNVVLAVAGCCALLSAQTLAATRATKEQIDKYAEGAEKCWAQPGSNYSYLVGCVIKPGHMSQSNLLARIASLMDKAETSLDKAALHYLAGETYYWTGLAEVMKFRNKSAMDGEQAVAAYLAAWDAVAQGGEAANLIQLRRTLVYRLDEVLATRMCGANLSTNLKQQVVARYIDRVEKEEALRTNGTLQQRAKIYSNLGIQGRLAAAMTTSIPTNFPGALRAMEVALAAGATNEALRYAAHLEEHFGAEFNMHPEARGRVFSVYKACSDPRSIPCLKALAATDPKAWLALYDYSVRLEPQLDVVQRRAYVDEYLKGLANKHVKDSSAYCAAIERLVAGGDYDPALELADKAISENGASTSRAIILRHKALVYELRGDKAKALEARQKGLADATTVGNEELQALFRQDLEARPAQVGAEGVIK